MKLKTILFLWVISNCHLSAQSAPRPVGNVIAFGACTQTYFYKNSPSDAMLGLPRSGTYYEASADFLQQHYFGMFVALRWGHAADRDEGPMQQLIEQKYAGYLITAPRRNPDPLKMRQYLLGARLKIGHRILQYQPGFAIGLTKCKLFAFDAAIKAPKSNALFRTDAAFQYVDYTKKNHFTLQFSQDLFCRLVENAFWLQATGALLMVFLPYDTVELTTRNELTHETSIEYFKSSKYKYSGSFSLGLVIKIKGSRSQKRQG